MIIQIQNRFISFHFCSAFCIRLIWYVYHMLCLFHTKSSNILLLFFCSVWILQVLAIDRDIGENGRVTYSIKSGKGKAKFRIAADTGVIYAAKAFESDAEYDIIVRAEDNGLPKKSQTTLVSVIVVDTPTSKENANPPQIKTSDQRVEVTENDNPGFLVTLIQAYDEDNDQLWFDIIGTYRKHKLSRLYLSVPLSLSLPHTWRISNTPIYIPMGSA